MSDTTVTAIKDEIQNLPREIANLSWPLQAVLREAKDEAEALKLVSSVWFGV
ncbi:hypothetical protein [Aeromonas veronii]|uniref:hypothetical protein n=1 Tax=Aeromonas veronii TaxID=654 RepID=UPI003A86FF5D